MQRDVNKNVFSHPSNKELADFVDGTLNENRRAEITKHLIACDECSDVVALVMKYGEKKIIDDEVPEPVNNYNYKGVGIFLGGLAMASLVIFINFPNGKLGKIDLSIPPTIQYQDSQKIILRDEIIDADKILNTIINSIDLSKIKTFQYAQEREKKGETEEAKALYKQAFIKSLNETDNKKRLKQKIVIHSKLFHLSKEDKEKNEYRDILRYEIRLYILNFDTRSKQ